MRNYYVIDFKNNHYIFSFSKGKQIHLASLIAAADRAGVIFYNNVGRSMLRVPGYGVGQELTESEVLSLRNGWAVNYES